jgi:hypothetical protein
VLTLPERGQLPIKQLRDLVFGILLGSPLAVAKATATLFEVHTIHET